MYRIFVLLVGIKATSFYPGQFLGTAPNVCRQKSAVEELGGTDIFPDLHPDDVKCGGNYDDSEDMITSPYIPNADYYPNDCFCDYIIGMDWAGSYATISFEFLKLDIAGGGGYCEDKLEILSDKDLSTKLVDDICGNTLPPKITHKVEFPVTLRFTSDIDHRQHKGFIVDYKIQFESEGDKSFRVAEDLKPEEEEESSVNLGLLFGIMAFLIAILIVAVYIYKRQNEQLKTELNGPEPLQMSTLVMSAEENIYDEIGPLNNQSDGLIRTESQDSVAMEKERALRLMNESRALPDLPNDSEDIPDDFGQLPQSNQDDQNNDSNN